MSARTLERPELDNVRPAAPAAVRSGTRTATVPELRLEAQIRPVRKRRVRKSLFERVFLSAGSFTALAFVSYLASGLAAQVSAESARQSGFRASARAEAAIRSGEAVSGRIEKLTSRDAVHQWALAHGMKPSVAPAEERNLVAYRD